MLQKRRPHSEWEEAERLQGIGGSGQSETGMAPAGGGRRRGPAQGSGGVGARQEPGAPTQLGVQGRECAAGE